MGKTSWLSCWIKWKQVDWVLLIGMELSLGVEEVMVRNIELEKISLTESKV